MRLLPVTLILGRVPPPPEDPPENPLKPTGNVFGNEYELAGFGDRNKQYRWSDVTADPTQIANEYEQRISNMHVIRITDPQGNVRHRTYVGFITDDFGYGDAVQELIERGS